jgi:hypothetical protein
MRDIKDFVEEHYDGLHKGKYPDYHSEIKITKEHKFMFYVYRQKVDFLGNKVISEKIIKNRSTYWVPKIQI